MATKKATTTETATQANKEKKDGGRKQAKRYRPIEDCPIGVGGGTGIYKRGFPIGGITICFPFDEDELLGYKRDDKDKHKYSNKNFSLRSLPVVDEGQPVPLPSFNSNSRITIDCSDVRSPNTGERVSIIIKVKPLGIKFTGDWVFDSASGCFHCSYLAIREIYVDNHRPYRSPRGRCALVAHNY